MALAAVAVTDTFAIVSFYSKNGIAVTRIDGTNSPFRIHFPRSLSVPISLSSTQPVRRILGSSNTISNKWVFKVHLPIKEQKTAIGWVFQDPPTEQYLTPDYVKPSSTSSGTEEYISMGGAGFIYPSKRRASKGYAVMDTIETTLDFSSNEISYAVNGQVVHTIPIPSHIDLAYPTISSDGGEVVAIASVENCP
eukprot:gene27382-36149_t